MEDPENWRWIWLVAAAIFAGGEMLIAGSFFLAPLAIGATVAAILAFLDVSLAGQWLAFVGISVAAFASLRPLVRKLDRDAPSDGIGSKRLIGEEGTVLEAIPAGPHELGLVRVHREEWRAQTIDGNAVDKGITIRVVEQRGTRLVVVPRPTPPQIQEM
jgi:membrane protein implicated in regulation of membrane protease activity